MVHDVSFALSHSPLSHSGTSKNNSLHINGQYVFFYIFELSRFKNVVISQRSVTMMGLSFT